MAQLDLSGLTRFGNMTSGSGLNAIFDNNTGSAGYNAAANGYAGVTFAAPQKIDKIEVVSASNGFDASGLTSQITLRLYGKVGVTPPVHDADGDLLGTAGPFTDVNAFTTKVIESSNKTTEYSHVWVKGSTGVWVVFSELRMFDPVGVPPIEPPEPSAAARPVYIKSVNVVVPLPWFSAEIVEFRMSPFAIAAPAIAEIDLHCDVTHRGEFTGYNGAVGVGLTVAYRYGATIEAMAAATLTQVANMTGGFNISERNPQHYGARSVTGAVALVVGFYQFTVIGSAHSDGSSSNGLAAILAEGGKGLNLLRVIINKDGELIAA